MTILRQCKKYYAISVLGSILLLLSACGKSAEQDDAARIYTVTSQVQTSNLFFTSNIEPLAVIHVASPVDGVITSIYVRYGQQVKQGDPLLVINSDQLKQQYQEALTNFVKARADYAVVDEKMQGTQVLHQRGLISRNRFEQEKRDLADRYLAFKIAEARLSEVLNNVQNLALPDIDYETVTIKELGELQETIASRVNQLNIRAPTFGVVLPMSSNQDKNKSAERGLVEGSKVEANKPILAIGDFTGLSLKIKVSEIDLASIAPGQKVRVTGVAFPGVSLAGVVGSIDTQTDSSGYSGQLPTFPVKVVVPLLSADAQAKIRQGMSAKVEVITQEETTLSVPIKAVFIEAGQPKVKRLLNEKTREYEVVDVSTGKTSMQQVIINSGLQAGDKILVDD
jgi:HlyD family secretion protein